MKNRAHRRGVLVDPTKQTFALYIRNLMFGVEDGLVSTVGLLSGVAYAGVPRTSLILTGLVLIFVEAFSMASGSLVSEHSAEEYVEHSEVPFHRSLIGALIMFFSYFASGLVPLIPYVLLSGSHAIWVSIAISLVALAVVGVVSARAFGMHVFKHGLEMLCIGGAAIFVGVLVGGIVGL